MKHIPAAQWRRIALVVLSVLGCAVVWLSHDAHADSQGFAAQFCGQLGGGCDRAFDSPWAVFPPGSNEATEFSMPMTVIGMFHFGFLLIWFLLIGIPSYGRRWWHLVPTIEITGAFATALLLVRVIVAEELWCIYCIASHIITLILGLGIFTSWPRKQTDSVESACRPATAWAICVLGVSCVLAIVVLLSAVPSTAKMDRYQAQVHKLIERHFKQSPVEITVEESDAIQPATTRASHHTLIVFFDAQCPPCKLLLAYIEETILPQFDGRLTVVYKHYPMASRCNPSVPNLHPHACEAAYLLEAARQQGGIDSFLRIAKLVYQHEGAFDQQTVRSFAKETNLVVDRLELALSDSELVNRIKRDIQLGTSLNIKGTPVAFLDGLEIAGPLLAMPEFWKVAAEREQFDK